MLYTSRKVHADCPVLLDLGHRQGAYLRWLSFNGKGFARCGARLPVNLSHLTISWATASRAAEGDARASGEFRAVLVEELGPSSSGSRPSPGSRRPSRPTSGQLTAPDASITTAGCSRRPPFRPSLPRDPHAGDEAPSHCPVLLEAIPGRWPRRATPRRRASARRQSGCVRYRRDGGRRITCSDGLSGLGQSATARRHHLRVRKHLMATLHIQHPISDTGTWKAAFDRFAEARAKSGVRAA